MTKLHEAPPLPASEDTLRMTRIGTWNLDTEWNVATKPPPPRQVATLVDQMRFIEKWNCDFWLLTEVPCFLELEPGNVIFSQRMGASDKAYAAVWAKDGLEELSEKSLPTAAIGRVGDMRVCSCVLPWRFAPSQGWPVKGDYKTIVDEAIARLGEGLAHGPGDLVLGGDWNQAFAGRDYVGTLAGRAALNALLETLNLTLTTGGLDKHTAKGEHRSIDHIAVPRHWKTCGATRRVAERDDGLRLSDHDAYTVDLEL
jgi:hypothetical protein